MRLGPLRADSSQSERPGRLRALVTARRLPYLSQKRNAGLVARTPSQERAIAAGASRQLEPGAGRPEARVSRAAG
jgi:hypothetical protein